MEAIGIDLGSNKAVLAVVKKGGIDIVLNEGSNRATPVQLAYTAEERLIGDSVKFQIRKNMKNTILFPTRFLGLNAQCETQLALEKRFISHDLVMLDNKKIVIEVSSQGNKHQMTIEQVMAYYLTKLKKFYENSEIMCKDIVLSIPSYCSNVERQSLLDAADIAGLKCLRVINESTAIALQYGFFRKADLDAKEARVVCFVDMGHSKTTITIASFIQGKTKIIVHKSDRNLGAREFDWELVQLLGGEFAKKYGADPRKNAKCIVRMLEGVEKARKMLSSVPDAQVNVDYLLEEEDLVRTVKREEFEGLIEPYTARFEQLIRDTVTASGMTPSQIHSIEMIGDATRTPKILDIVKNIFDKETLRTLNSIETIARGAALQSAMLSPQFQVANFVIEEYNSLPVQMEYNFVGADQKSSKIFDHGSMFPLTKNVTFDNKLGNMQIMLKYAEDAQILEGLPKEIAQYQVGEGKAKNADKKDSKVKLTLKVQNSIHQIPGVEGVDLIESWSEEVKIPIKVPAPVTPAAKPEAGKEAEKPAESVQQFETKLQSKTRTSPVQVNTSHFALLPETLTKYKEVEKTLYNEDRKFLDWKESKNQLETLSYKYREGIEGKMGPHMDPAVKGEFVASIQKIIDFIYSEAGEQATYDDYMTRIKAFQAVVEPVKKRYIFYGEIEERFAKMNQLAIYTEHKLKEIHWLTDEQRKNVIDKVQIGVDFTNALKAEFSKKDKWCDPSVWIGEVDSKLRALEAETTGIFNTPEPRKEEPKAAESEPMVEGEAPKEDCSKDCDNDAPKSDDAKPKADGDQDMN